MRALLNRRAGGPEVLEVVAQPDPTPGSGAVVIRVRRAGLNFADISGRVGLYPDAPPFPFIAGYEVAGEVAALGDGVSGFSVGDRVLALTRFGGQATMAAADAWRVRKLPDSVSYDAAAAVPVNYLTAFHMLFEVAPLKPGMSVLVHMAAGGVGLAVIDLVSRIEGTVLFGTASASKHAFLREHGLHHPIDYRTLDYSQELRRLTGGVGVHRVLDPLGGKDWEKGYRLLRPGGILICYGWANMIKGSRRNPFRLAGEYFSAPRFSPMGLMDANRGVLGVNIGHLWGERTLLNRHLDTLVGRLGDGTIRPHIDKVFPLNEAAEAHRWVQGRNNVGKVLFDCDA